MSLLSKQSWTLPLWADPALRCYNLSIVAVTFRGKVWVAGELTMKAKLNITTVSWSSIEMLQPFYCCCNIQGQGMSSWWAYYQNKAEHYHCELIQHWVTTFLLLLQLVNFWKQSWTFVAVIFYFAVTFRGKVWVAGELTMKKQSWTLPLWADPTLRCYNLSIVAVTFRGKVWVAGEFTIKA